MRLLGGAGASTLLRLPANGATVAGQMLLREIPSTAEKLPAIGLGTFETFDVGTSPGERKSLREVIQQFVRLGGKVIDSSPMYGRAEGVIGDLITELKLRDQVFVATKVWTTGRQEGIASMERSLSRLRTKRVDLMQVHNLVDLQTQLATARAWKEQGRIRYVGVTHYAASALPELEKVLQREKLDFIQINYSIIEREAEQRVLPLAHDRGVAVLINRPFAQGDLFSRLRSKPLPSWVQDFDCHSWAQFLLKWILANPSVTCAIPATANPQHLKDNMGAGLGRLPDDNMRRRMTDLVTGRSP
jgi:diketogulonate reductase-like aldo/keto reductase